MKLFKNTFHTLFACVVLAMGAAACASDKPKKDASGKPEQKPSAKRSVKKVFGPEAITASKQPVDFNYERVRSSNTIARNEGLDNGLTHECFELSRRDVSITQAALNSITQLLLLGANPNALDVAGQTPLHLAVFDARKTALVQQLINWKTDHQIQDINGFTALHTAAKNNNAYAVFCLIRHGATESADRFGKLPSHYATLGKNKDTQKLFPSLAAAKDAYKQYRLEIVPALKALRYPNDICGIILSYIPQEALSAQDLPRTINCADILSRALPATTPQPPTQSTSALAYVEPQTESADPTSLEENSVQQEDPHPLSSYTSSSVSSLDQDSAPGSTQTTASGSSTNSSMSTSSVSSSNTGSR